ncbi:hypothetical protein DWB85_04355 [Seongchinamella sediminis]|uniref:OmpR/PhoB-type domain-containing protein n=1 Tax=Seongchinamella sediminis TaxID=2283635 RepID=A0A3L7E3W8_9GAMM|nr:winged helix-turn-helix domain-containing protein [Seongchinamella sediminis]RLQ23203.1 hypothetical protein DWB85_04355 [Seongchinamella sediminis]
MTVYRLGEVDFDPDASEIRVQGTATHLQPEENSVLDCLIRHRGELLSKDTLAAEALNGCDNKDERLSHCVSVLSAHFPAGNTGHSIEAIADKGYRFSGPVEEVPSEELHPNAHDFHPVVNGDAEKTAVNLVITGAVIFLLLSTLIVASDFFTLR